MKRKMLRLGILCIVLLFVGFLVGRYAIEHRFGYGTIGYVNETISSDSSLDLSNQDLFSVPPNVFHMTSLNSLDLSGNNLSGSLPGEIRFLENLQTLDVSENAMTGVPAEIGQLSRLQYLNLSNNALTGLPNELGKLTSLLRLDLRGNTISPQDLNGIRAMLQKTEILVD